MQLSSKLTLQGSSDFPCRWPSKIMLQGLSAFVASHFQLQLLFQPPATPLVLMMPLGLFKSMKPLFSLATSLHHVSSPWVASGSLLHIDDNATLLSH